MKTVLQKFIADSGYCSRRKAEELIRRGKVTVNGRLAELGMRAGGDDEVIVAGKRMELKENKIYIKLNKPKGYVCTTRIFKGEKNIFSLVKIKERLFAVGRLDKDSRGLVLLTNDGRLAQKISHPRYGHEKKYLAKVRGRESRPEDVCAALKKGVYIGDGDGIVKTKSARYAAGKFEIVLTEGKKRQIRRMFKALGLETEDLLRAEIAGVKLGDLKEGEWRELSREEINRLNYERDNLLQISARQNTGNNSGR